MSRSDQPHVDAMRATASEAFEFLFLQDAQKFGLQRQRYVANLIEKKRAFVG